MKRLARGKVQRTIARLASPGEDVHSRSKISAFLFTDIEGSTRLWQCEPERMPGSLACHDALLRTAVESHHGTVVKTMGDGICAVFDDPLDGVSAALALQRALADPGRTNGIELRVRCGLHVGAAEQRDGDYFGTTLNRAARIMGAAHGGQVLLSQGVAELVLDRLPPGTGLHDQGAVRLRDLAGPARIYQLTHADLRRTFPALRSLEATPNNLPQQVTSFVGRERELARVRDLLAQSRLVSLVGPGGIGKTRLSLQLAADLLEDFPDGIWFIEFAAIVDPSLVPKVVAQALGLQEDADTPVAQALCAHLASRRTLLVLDNCEHLVHACAAMADALLRSAPDIRVLASSREALNIAGEQTYPMPALEVPGPGSGAADAARSDAGRLFVERARSRQPAFTLDDRNASAVSQICARLDGIPLALELAAARVGVLSVETIAERLNDRFHLLTGGSRAALPRQQTLRALIDWSYDLLDATERILFARLSVFAGGWTLAAAERVGADDKVAPGLVLDLLAALSQKSLVAPIEDQSRFRMLETIREYARGRLAESGEQAPVRARHRDCFVALAEEAEPHLEGGPLQPEWLARLEFEHDNLRAALTTSLEDGDDVESGLRLCGSLYRFWAHRGHAREGREWCAGALARTAGRPGTTSHLKALHASGTLAWRLGEITAARSELHEALQLSRELGDRPREGRILNNLGGVAIHQADDQAAQAFLEQAVAIHAAMGNRAMEARALNNMAALAVNRGRFAEADAPLARALTLSRELGNPMEEATALSHLGFLAQQRGEFTQARTLHEKALATALAFGVREFEVEEVRHLGEVALAVGDRAAAREHFRSALATSKEIGNQHEIVLCIEAVTTLLVAVARYNQAILLCGASDAWRAIIVTPRAFNSQAQHASTLARCREALGEDAVSASLAEGMTIPGEQAVASTFAWLDEIV
ncbi:MAG: tetratricopeptide repeat protein [Burkholderiales bacterium]